MDRETLLRNALEQRQQAVLEYQINIDNFKAAIEEVRSQYSDDTTLQPFLTQLKELLASNILEQKKEKIMLKVIEDQLK